MFAPFWKMRARNISIDVPLPLPPQLPNTKGQKVSRMNRILTRTRVAPVFDVLCSYQRTLLRLHFETADEICPSPSQRARLKRFCSSLTTKRRRNAHCFHTCCNPKHLLNDARDDVLHVHSPKIRIVQKNFRDDDKSNSNLPIYSKNPRNRSKCFGPEW